MILKAVCICSGTVLSCGKDNLLKTVNPQTFEVMQTFRAPQFSVGTIWCTPCISPDGQHVAAGSGNGSLFVWNVSHQTAPGTAPLHRFCALRKCMNIMLQHRQLLRHARHAMLLSVGHLVQY